MKRWGPWSLNEPNMMLEHDNGRKILLSMCTTSAEILDMIAQIAGKPEQTAESIGHLVLALDELLKLQANICSGGREQGQVGDVAAFIRLNRDEVNTRGMH